MRRSLSALVTVPWLLLATVSMAQSVGTKSPPRPPPPPITFVEVVQLNFKTQTFHAQLVDLSTQMVIVDKVGNLDRAGKGPELDAFKKESESKAPRVSTVCLTGPGSPITSIGTVNPPPPPHPPGDDLLQFIRDMSKSAQKIEAVQPVQTQFDTKNLQQRTPNTVPAANQQQILTPAPSDLHK